MLTRSLIVLTLLLTLSFRTPPQARAQHGTKDGQWTTYAGDQGSTRYAPLDQINKQNFNSLKVVWSWDSPDGFLSKPEAGGLWRGDLRTITQALSKDSPNVYKRGGEPRGGALKATPLAIDGLLYVVTPLYQAAAIDAKTGKSVWLFNPNSYAAGTPTNVITWNSRGCSYWTDGKQGRIIWGTGDGYLLAVDAKTGRPCADFGDKGRVDLMTGIPRAEREKRDEFGGLLYSVTSPPAIYKDTIISGGALTDRRPNMDNPPGWVRGWDARTGKLKWVFHTIPLAGEFGAETWTDGANAFTGNANVWAPMSVDDELGYVYLPVSTPSNDYYGGHRPGDGLFGESLVCLNAETGERIWHFQTTHHGMWDYDLPSQPILLDVKIDAKPRKIVAQLSKQGFVYVFDRVNGQPIWPIVERPVPQEPRIPGEQPSPTQPFPTKPAPITGQGTTEDQVIDFTPELHQQAMEILKHYQTGPLFQPQTLATIDGTWGTIQRPSLAGSTTWPGGCADPESGSLFVPSRDAVGITYYYEPKPERDGSVRYTSGGRAPEGSDRLQGPQGLPLWKPPYSRMTAVDLNTGDVAWMKPSGMGSDRMRNHPALKGISLPPLGGEGRGGPIVTKTLMISWRGTVRGEGGGGEEPQDAGGPGLVAYDKVSGEEVGFVPLPSSPIGVPMTYLADGKQYIAVTIGGAVPKVVAVALPEK